MTATTSPARTLARLLPALVLLAACGRGSVYHLVGTVERTRLELTAPISEVLVESPVKLGQRVEADQVVVRLDSEVAAAEQRAGEASVAAAQAAATDAEREFDRVQSLSERRVASAQELDRATRQRDEARATLAEREARLAQARRHLADLELRAHRAGIVDQLPFEVGERVPAGAVVAVVQTDDKPWVRVWLPAAATARLTPEARAAVTVEGLPSTFHGTIADVGREPEFTPHYALTERESSHLVYQARILLADAPADLRPGLPAQVTLTLPPRPPAAR
jgi:HlyD family secretion protein